MFVGEEELEGFIGYVIKTVVFDYIIFVESDVFVFLYFGNMVRVVEGYCRFLGYCRIIVLDRFNFNFKKVLFFIYFVIVYD